MSKDRIASACRELATSRDSMVTRGINECKLGKQYGELHGEGSEEERAQRMEEWKALVVEKVLKRELEEWRKELNVGTKSEIYKEIKEAPGFETYLRSREYWRGGILRFKLRSGMLYLQDEVGRRNRREGKGSRECLLCKSGAVEDAKHFLFVCPKLSHVREVFRERLSRVCSLYNIPSLVDEWNSGDVSSCLRIILGDSLGPFRENLDRGVSPGEASQDLRLVSNSYLSSAWSARKHLLYSDLAVPLASGANVPLSGSAS